MNKVKFTVLAAILLTWMASLQAAVYKSVDAQGNVVYTDEPTGNGKPVDLPPLSTIPPPKYTLSKPSVQSDTPDAGYKQLSIASPTADETLRDNTGAVPVSAAIEPALNVTAGHLFQFYLDGQTQGEPTASARIVLANVDRGTHNVSVAVIDAEGKEVMRSDPVPFHLHRQSINFPRGPGVPSPAPAPRAR
ncbi:MAG: DUF4124 domain-containing protein [Thiogranum sp.]